MSDRANRDDSPSAERCHDCRFQFALEQRQGLEHELEDLQEPGAVAEFLALAEAAVSNYRDGLRHKAAKPSHAAMNKKLARVARAARELVSALQDDDGTPLRAPPLVWPPEAAPQTVGRFIVSSVIGGGTPWPRSPSMSGGDGPLYLPTQRLELEAADDGPSRWHFAREFQEQNGRTLLNVVRDSGELQRLAELIEAYLRVNPTFRGEGRGTKDWAGIQLFRELIMAFEKYFPGVPIRIAGSKPQRSTFRAVAKLVAEAADIHVKDVGDKIKQALLSMQRRK